MRCASPKRTAQRTGPNKSALWISFWLLGWLSFSVPSSTPRCFPGSFNVDGGVMLIGNLDSKKSGSLRLLMLWWVAKPSRDLLRPLRAGGVSQFALRLRVDCLTAITCQTVTVCHGPQLILSMGNCRSHRLLGFCLYFACQLSSEFEGRGKSRDAIRRSYA